jgi:hypothetical protein
MVMMIIIMMMMMMMIMMIMMMMMMVMMMIMILMSLMRMRNPIEDQPRTLLVVAVLAGADPLDRRPVITAPALVIQLRLESPVALPSPVGRRVVTTPVLVIVVLWLRSRVVVLVAVLILLLVLLLVVVMVLVELLRLLLMMLLLLLLLLVMVVGGRRQGRGGEGIPRQPAAVTDDLDRGFHVREPVVRSLVIEALRQRKKDTLDGSRGSKESLRVRMELQGASRGKTGCRSPCLN